MTPDSLDGVDPTTLVAGRGDWIGEELAAALVEHPLDCVDTEFPHDTHAVESPDDTVSPSEDHPVFYGCFDWHSAVHSHWSLVRGLRLFGDSLDRDGVVGAFDDRVTAETVQREVAYFAENPGFENPYGWGWFLRLAAELALWDDSLAGEWRERLRPLEDRVVELVESEFLTQDRPFRVGTHGNSAFSLCAVVDYARVVGDESLAEATVDAAGRFYGDDTDAPVAYEPLGWDFVSPSLTEADLMRRVLDDERFGDWYERFLGDLSSVGAQTVLEPVDVGDDDGGVALHLVGLNLSRAWCLAGIADALGDHPATPALERSARRHAEAGVAEAFTDDYAGAHWLSSYVLYLLTHEDGGVAPSG
ncbi:MAG: DUF2891 domain-containing protein [Haloarculaceae archaeon]